MRRHRALIGYLVLTGFVFLALFSSYQTGQELTSDQAKGCLASKANRTALRAIYVDANRRTQTSGQRSAEEKRDATEFTKHALSLLPPIQCLG